jgi:DNA-binding Lrp family transcriptional regulator
MRRVSELVQAYVLITATIGKVRQVSRELRKIKGVKSVHVVTGPYDIIVFVEARSLDQLSSTVVEDIHRVKGVVDTNTAIVVEV